MSNKETRNVYDLIKISYCRKHQEYWVQNCPDCMADDAEREAIEWLDGLCEHYPPQPQAKLSFIRKGMKRIQCPECLQELMSKWKSRQTK